ncbi:4-diphosphocytidyl-2-C-methyl-D-erythritol kinase [Corynebacterium faecale]|uniref:4-(cytidine 5'-diphospho)-2-C-methyl-D-erythritol kinase n=1 Tax=Corynebacterium faecale TaxID=1758466 RepID=UPI0025B4D42C|nr:4-(cytidine 5'-diphospho)-2-C-methyl-D-erythritol kinase [Corynebacterium faecale]WJY91653.1 4-diphosphocytidyl-2-C-methyl-D-erythritol kinase [Corynebacterium faecale]
MKITAKAWGKINLHLGVGPAREDGYHELVTVFQTINLAETITLTTLDEDAPEQGSVVKQLSVTGPRGVPTDPSNLAWRAVDALVARWRATNDGPLPMVELHIQKGIPVAGGMAGGSADAAAALRAVDAWIGPFGEDTLLEVAAELGSDVPFCLLGGTMLGTGRGEQLVDMLNRGTYHWSLVVSPKGLSTPEVFRKFDEMSLPSSMDVTAMSQALVDGSVWQLVDVLENDLAAAALSLRPDLRKTQLAGIRAGALTAMVSGSGPTIALLCRDEQGARDVTDALLDEGLGLSVHAAISPVPGKNRGAHIVSIESE